jgi:hypothetical protein
MPDADDQVIETILANNQRSVDAWARADWDEYAAAVTPDLVVVDHRPASLGAIEGRDAFISATRVLREMLADASVELVQYAINPRGALAQNTVIAEDPSGGRIEVSFVVLSTVRDGVMDRMEMYPLEDLDLAKRRFQELTEPDG